MKQVKSHAPLSSAEIESVAALFKVLGEPMRLRILQSVCHSPQSVGDIVEATGATQANISKHLALLAASGVVERQRQGQQVFYGIKNRLVIKLCESVRAQLHA
ncbi:MAG TPA: metalloregulator ArsR/SmtB family transcription factor [Candidatus Limnocylindria bacterium]|jgi:ArsR family transcriptional regulator|nr:metalloregulator ArsR/SmtB family transcription factor [Candidatus Limnocylindria bacterium]